LDKTEDILKAVKEVKKRQEMGEKAKIALNKELEEFKLLLPNLKM